MTTTRWTAVGMACVILLLGTGWLTALKRVEGERASAATNIHRFTSERVRAQMQLQEQLNINAALETSINQRTRDIATYSNRVETALVSLTKASDTARKEADRYRSELAVKDQQIADLLKERTSLSGRVDEVTAKIAALQSRITESENRLTTVEKEREGLKTELRSLMAEKASLERRFQDVAFLRGQLRTLQGDREPVVAAVAPVKATQKAQPQRTSRHRVSSEMDIKGGQRMQTYSNRTASVRASEASGRSR